MRSFIEERKSLVIYYICCTVLMSVQLLAFDLAVGVSLSLGIMTVMCVTEAAFISSFIWIFGRKWRILMPVIITLLLIFLWCNLLYYRYWNDLIPFSLIAEAASYNSLVFDAVPGLLRFADVGYILIPIFLFILFAILKVANAPYLSWKEKLLVLALALIIYGGGQLVQIVCTMRYWRRAEREVSFSSLVSSKLPQPEYFSRERVYSSNGLLLYIVHMICNGNQSHLELNSTQRSEIERFLTHNKIPSGSEYDCEFVKNSHKNLILIIVESLNAPYIGQTINNYRVTPNLDTLINSEGTISCMSVIPQISDGASSDGQLMYNTGMLPLKNEAVAMRYAENKWHSLAEDPNFAQTSEIIVEKGGLWNHSITSRSYSYDKLINNLDHETMSMDAAVMARAISEIDSARQPFMIQITTLSMHNPFDDRNTPDVDWISSANKSNVEKRYMLALHEFDRALGDFIALLKNREIYDNSVIVIVSDHNIAVTEKDISNGPDYPIAFIALNTGHTEKVPRTVGQIDVYPTIREIMGRSDGWHGLGMSILDPRNNSAVDASGALHSTSGQRLDSLKHEAWRISDLMIRGNYFETVQ